MWAVPPVVPAADLTQSKAGSGQRVVGRTPRACAPLPPARLRAPGWGAGGWVGGMSSSRSQVWLEGGNRAQSWGWASVLPAPHDALLPHRLPQPPRRHVREPVGSLVHGEAGGCAPRLHRHPGERPAAPERGGEPSERPGLSIPSHRLRPGPALGSAGGPSGGQPGGSAQLAGRCPSATPAPRRVLPADATLGGPHWAPRQAGRPRADSASCSRRHGRREPRGADAGRGGGEGARVLDAALPLRGARACHVPSGVMRSSAATAATVPHGHPSPLAPCQESTRTPLLARCRALRRALPRRAGAGPAGRPSAARAPGSRGSSCVRPASPAGLTAGAEAQRTRDSAELWAGAGDRSPTA